MMSRVFLLIGLYCCSYFHSLSAKIIEASKLEDIEEYFETLDSQSLLLWDVDSTLIIPNDQVLRPGNESLLHELVWHYMGKDVFKEKWQWLISHVWQCISFDLVDPSAPQLIASLQSRSIPMIAFTALQTGSFGIIPSLENWRVQQLRQLGIDFCSTLSEYSGLKWQVTSQKLGSPVFKDGILFSDCLAKGPVLVTFLQKIHWKPNQLIFIDDRLSYLTSVKKAVEDLNIPFIGIYYRARDHLEFSIDLQLAHLQFQVLTKEERWLSDAEAKCLLEEISQKQEVSEKNVFKMIY